MLTPVQVLWVNMVTSVTISFALAFEPLEPGAMRRPPRDPKEPLLGRYFLFRILYVGVVMGGACLVLSFRVLNLNVLSVAEYQTIIIQTLVVCEGFYLFNVRYIYEPAFCGNFLKNRVPFAVLGIMVVLQLGITYLPFLNRAMGTAPLTAWQWIPAFVVALILFCAVELEKFITRRLRPNETGCGCSSQEQCNASGCKS